MQSSSIIKVLKCDDSNQKTVPTLNPDPHVQFFDLFNELDHSGGGGVAWHRGRAWWGTCMAGGHVWQGGIHGSGACMAGVACLVGGMHSRGACIVGGQVWWGACVTGETATTADGTHPTGMHSC